MRAIDSRSNRLNKLRLHEVFHFIIIRKSEINRSLKDHKHIIAVRIHRSHQLQSSCCGFYFANWNGVRIRTICALVIVLYSAVRSTAIITSYIAVITFFIRLEDPVTAYCLDIFFANWRLICACIWRLYFADIRTTIVRPTVAVIAFLASNNNSISTFDHTILIRIEWVTVSQAASTS